MRDRTSGIALRGVLAAIATVAVCGCERMSPITSVRVEAGITQTFSNLVHLQVSLMGLPPMAASDFAVNASCRTLAGSSAGSGEWICTLVWRAPDHRLLRDTYDLFVATDGCYMATVSGESLGGPILKASNGSDVKNLLYAFDGCFDTT